MKKKLNILVCPLNWGLGHASRDIPIIFEFIKRGHNVIVAGSENTNALLKEEFPNLKYLLFNGFKIKYPNKKLFFLYFLLKFPYFLFKIFDEHYKLKKIIKINNIYVVISDNRYGLWNKNIFTVFITHQLFIKLPFKSKILEKAVLKINKYFINKFDKCWVPDYCTEPFMSGDLSHKDFFSNKVSFIGILSRFNGFKRINENNNFEYDVTAIISGPEPQRTQFQEILILQLKKLNFKCLIVTGKPNENKEYLIDNIKIVSHLSTNEMYNVINKSKYIVSRAGYTTIMDLITLNRTAILVPTPGQTEQEYLSDYYSEKKIFLKMKQIDFDINKALKDIKEYKPINFNNECVLLNNEIDKIEKQLL